MKLRMVSYIFPVTGEISAQPGDDQGIPQHKLVTSYSMLNML